MTLAPEWLDRIEQWKNELTRHFYLPVGEIEMQGFTTLEQLSAEEAAGRTFNSMPQGTRWGAKWEYGWFRGEVELPPEAAGKRIVLDLQLGGESVVYADGQVLGTYRADWIQEKHHYICDLCLSQEGKTGERHQLLVECYAGHGPRVCTTGPIPPGRLSVPEPEAAQVQVGNSTYGIWQEAAYQLWLDVRMLLDIRNNLDPLSLRVAKIDRALKDFTLLVDFEQEPEGMTRSFKAARERLKPLMASKNGGTAPVFYTFGHSHIDVAWLWPLAETERKCARTFSTQLAHMDMYPGYKFLQSQPHLYRMTKTLYPEVYERIRQKVAEGSFIPEGGMWVEADTNISSGESLIRQFLHGKKFFREEFGVDNELLWLPDVFGYTAALPQIMKGCGIRYFSTQKILWSYNGGERFPYNYFIWEGIDGSEVTAFIHDDYNSPTTGEALIRKWKNRVQKDDLDSFIVPFGYGDGGGGPTRDHIENILRTTDLEGVPKTRMEGPVAFFKDLEQQGLPPENRYVGEIYFQAHRGVYTTQARVKKGNRKCELALREAEIWTAAAAVLRDHTVPAAELDEAWKGVLLNQFHDILPGSSIARVYEEAEALHKQVQKKAGEISREAQTALCHAAKSLTVFNSLSWKRKARVQVPEDWQGAMDHTGCLLQVQQMEKGKQVSVEIPACGWTVIRPAAGGTAISQTLRVEERLLENEHLKLVFNSKGEITSIWDKDADCELASGLCNSMKLYKDVPRVHDAWDIDSVYEKQPVDLPEEARFRILSQGPLAVSLEICRKLNQSLMTQVVTLERDSRRVDFETSIDWQESHKLLKVAFPVNICSNEAVHEIQFGHIHRPNHRSRQYDADRFEVCNHKWTALMEENRGAAVLNDCKYGVNVLGDSINLTLLRASKAPDMNADIGVQTFTYAFYAWNGSFAESDLVREGYELNCPVSAVAGDGGHYSLLQVDAGNVVVEAVKPAEDGSGDVIIRLYESKRTAGRCMLQTGFPVTAAWETDMLENIRQPLTVEDGKIPLNFRAFEIRTIRLKPAK